MIDIWRAKSHLRASLCDLKRNELSKKSRVASRDHFSYVSLVFEWESVDYAVLLISKKYNSANFKSVSIPTLSSCYFKKLIHGSLSRKIQRYSPLLASG